jgi:hypothetical protein
VAAAVRDRTAAVLDVGDRIPRPTRTERPAQRPEERGEPVTVQLNKDALAHARGLLHSGDVVADERDDWSEHAPSADDENAFIDKHGMAEFAKWHLGEDTSKTEGTKGRYSFPYGDFRKLHRCAVISGESRAGQYDHRTIEKALKDLLGGIDRQRDTGTGARR